MDNLEKNTYATNQITNALIKLLEAKPIGEISISKIAETAGVSRVTFYRNYEDKADILRQKIVQLLDDHYAEFLKTGKGSDEYFGSLFGHFKENRRFYSLLFKNDLGYLLQTELVNIAGPKPEFDNKLAYQRAYFSYGLYGWIKEWMVRGMPEDTEDINRLLRENGGRLL